MNLNGHTTSVGRANARADDGVDLRVAVGFGSKPYVFAQSVCACACVRVCVCVCVCVCACVTIAEVCLPENPSSYFQCLSV